MPAICKSFMPTGKKLHHLDDVERIELAVLTWDLAHAFPHQWLPLFETFICNTTPLCLVLGSRVIKDTLVASSHSPECEMETNSRVLGKNIDSGALFLTAKQTQFMDRRGKET